MTAGALVPPDPLLQTMGDGPASLVAQLAVEADLDLEVQTATGEHATGRLTSDGRRIRLEFDRPEVLTGTAGRSTLSLVAAQLARAELGAELHGPRGRIAAVDPARRSRVAALLFGSPHITVDRSGWALAVRTVAPTTVTAVAVGATALLAVVATVVRRRRRS